MEKLQAVAASCHQARADPGLLEWTSPGMAGLQGECRDDLCGMAPSVHVVESPWVRLSMEPDGVGAEQGAAGGGQALP